MPAVLVLAALIAASDAGHSTYAGRLAVLNLQNKLSGADAKQVDSV